MTTADTLNFLSKLSIKRMLNAGAVLSSYHISKITGKPIQWGLPFNVSIEPTTNCNLGCPECPSGLKNFTRPIGNIDTAFYREAIDNMSPHLLYLYLYFQGEPYMHPAFFELVKYAAQNKIYTVTSTNAHYLTPRKAKQTIESGLDRIIISIDGTTQETYEQYRIGGNLEKVIEGTKNLVAAKREMRSKTPHILFQFLVVKPNEHQVENVRRLAKELGVDDVKMKTAQIYDYKKGHPLIPDNEMYSRYKKESNGTYSIKNEMKNHCWKLWHSSVITWDGKVVPCCFDKDAQHEMGNMTEKQFEAIWENEKYNAFRKSVLKSRNSIDICTNCSEGTKVWID